MRENRRWNTRLYKIWQDMKNRCNNPNVKCYPRYGGRGIAVCEEWQHDFSAFEEWAYAHGYREYLTIDRIDNDKGYGPDNCRWATNVEQAQNRRTTRLIVVNGVPRSISELSEMTGLPKTTISKRIDAGDSGLDLIRPKRKVVHQMLPHYEINGISQTANEWADQIGITREGFLKRWRAGQRGTDLLKPSRIQQPSKKQALPCTPANDTGESQ